MDKKCQRMEENIRRFMGKALLIVFITPLAFLLLTSVGATYQPGDITVHATDGTTAPAGSGGGPFNLSGDQTTTNNGAVTQPCTPGTLTQGVFFEYDQCQGFGYYVEILLKRIMPIVYTIVVVMLVWSGIEYMTSGVNAEGAKRAKNRIIGIVIGLIFYVLMRGIVLILK